MNRIALIALLVILVTSADAQKKNKSVESRLKGIEQELNKVLDTWQAPGFAVAVVEKNRIVYARGFGYSDLENKSPVTPNTLFAIGSCSKAFTTSLLGMLASENKVDLSQSPRLYVPDLKFYNEQMDELITIKDMMSHRTGLPRHDYSWYLFPTDSKELLLKRVQYQEPFADVREKWYYNNFMFLAQGVIIEELTGTSWETNVKEQIFTPLGMIRSNLSIAEFEQSADAAFGYELKDEELKKMDYYHIAGMSPAGSINSSVNEMANWLITWIHGGKYNDEQIIPENFVVEAMSSQMVVSGGAPGKENPDLHLSNYGFGWFNSSYKGHYRVQHGGNIDGFSANTCFFPSDSIGIVVLTNQNGSSVPSVVRNIIADKVLGETYTDWNKELKERRDKAIKDQKEAQQSAISNKKLNTSTSHNIKDYTGTYSHPGYGEFDMVVENDSLFAVFALKKFWFRHYHYDVFEPFEVTKIGIDTTDTQELKFSFISNVAGEISSLTAKIEQTLDPIEFKRSERVIEVAKGDLIQYVGAYEVGGMVAKVYTKGDSGLYLFVTGQPEYELLAFDQHKFSIKDLDGYNIEFVIGQNGEIGEALFVQPNGTFKAIKQ